MTTAITWPRRGQLAKAVDDDLGVNPLPLAEVLVAPARVGLMDATKAALRDLEVAELPFPSPVRLARLRATTGLRMPDCCVLLAAEDGATAATIATFDDRLVQAAEAREPAGRRTRNRFSITEAGRAALGQWLATDPEEPHFQVEGVLRTFFGDQGTGDDLVASMRTTAEMLGFVDEYLADGGPLSMLEDQTDRVAAPRVEFRGRPMYPERLHVVALAIDVTTRLLKTLDDFFTESGALMAEFRPLVRPVRPRRPTSTSVRFWRRHWSPDPGRHCRRCGRNASWETGWRHRR